VPRRSDGASASERLCNNPISEKIAVTVSLCKRLFENSESRKSQCSIAQQSASLHKHQFCLTLPVPWLQKVARRSPSKSSCWATLLLERASNIKPLCASFLSIIMQSRLVERFLMDGYEPHQDSTYALTLYRYNTEIEGKPVAVGVVKPFRARSPTLSSPSQISGTRRVKSASTACTLHTTMLHTHASS
jgi:hypothetical protein